MVRRGAGPRIIVLMSGYNEPRILAFERLSPRPIRIDWLGDVETTFRGRVRAQHIKVACSSWGGDTGWGETELDAEQFHASVPIAFLRLLRIGDIWHEGHRVGDARLQRKTFVGLRVEESLCEIIPAGGSSVCSDGVLRHDLPFFHFVGHRGHTVSHVVKVRVNPNTNLLVPCTELVRRYFADSGRLVASAFSGAFAMRTLFDPEASGISRTNRVANLRLGRGLTYHAAFTVARIAFDPAAKKAFQGLVNSGVAAAANDKRWYVRMGFPIEGLTDLTARGLWLDRGPDRSFLATQILSCSHPFPFDKLFFELQDDDASTHEPGGSGVAMGASGSKRQTGTARLGVDSGYANRDLSPLVLDAVDEPADPFPDLVGKKIFQVRRDTPSKGAPSRLSDVDSGEVHAPVGSPHAEGAPRGVEFVAARRLYRGGQPEPRPLLWLREEIAHSLPEVRAQAPFDGSTASRHLVRHGPPLRPRTSAVWATVFRYEVHGNLGSSFLCTVVESPASPQSIELLMFDIPTGFELNAPAFDALALLSFVPADNLLREARGSKLRIGWTADKLAEMDGASLATEMVEVMLRAFDRR